MLLPCNVVALFFFFLLFVVPFVVFLVVAFRKPPCDPARIPARTRAHHPASIPYSTGTFATNATTTSTTSRETDANAPRASGTSRISR